MSITTVIYNYRYWYFMFSLLNTGGDTNIFFLNIFSLCTRQNND